MDRFRRCLVLLLASLAGLSWGAGLDVPLLTDADAKTAAGHLPVAVPADRILANEILFGYNADLIMRAGVAHHPDELVPLDALAKGYQAGADLPEEQRGVQWERHFWRLPRSDGADPYPGLGLQDLVGLGFDLRRHPDMPGVYVLLVPFDEERVEVLQRFIDLRCRERGLPVPRATTQAGHDIDLGTAVSVIAGESGVAKLGLGNVLMILVGLVLFYLGVAKGFEPLLLVPIGMGCIFVNAVGADMARGPDDDYAGGILWFFSEYGITTGLFPLLIFLGVGSLTDFGPLLANPWSALLGGAAQFGIFGAFFLAAIVGGPVFGFTLEDAGAIAIIGGADGPTSIFVASKLAPDKLGAIAVAAYSYMALVPIIQPPVMRALTNAHDRQIMMQQRREVSKQAKILFPVVVILLCLLLLPSAVPLIGMLMFGNLLRESGVTDRLAKCAQNELINLVTVALGLSVGTKLLADKFLTIETLGILVLGCVAFVIGTATGVLFGKLMCVVTKGRVNPLIGAAGVSAVPMAARVVHSEGVKYNRRNMLLMHAMGPNVSGVIGSAVAAGVLLALLG